MAPADTPRSTQAKKTDVIKETLNAAGLLTNVYARSDLRNRNSSEPVVVLFILHGRLDSSDTVDPTVRAAFAWAAERQASSKQSPRDFVVVTFVRGVSSFLEFAPAQSHTLGMGGRRCDRWGDNDGRTGHAEPRHEIGGRSREHGMES